MAPPKIIGNKTCLKTNFIGVIHSNSDVFCLKNVRDTLLGLHDIMSICDKRAECVSSKCQMPYCLSQHTNIPELLCDVMYWHWRVTSSLSFVKWLVLIFYRCPVSLKVIFKWLYDLSTRFLWSNVQMCLFLSVCEKNTGFIPFLHLSFFYSVKNWQH